MKHIFLTLGAILLLSGCTFDPAVLALIPTPVPQPPHHPCDPNWETVFTFHEGPYTEIRVFCGDQPVEDTWLRDWADDAIARDGASRMREAFGRNAKKIEVAAFYMHLFLKADRSCLEDRGELVALIETSAQQYRDREYVDFPLLAVAHLLSSDYVVPRDHRGPANQESSAEAERVDCSDKLAASTLIPDPPPLCFAADPDAERVCYNEAPESSSGATPGQCNPDELAISPGQTVTDEVSAVQAAHIELTAVTTKLSGETLTVVFHLRDIPESLTFDRTGLHEGRVEYKWEVSIDVDNDLNTGAGGFEYTLSALHFVHSSSVDANTTEAIQDKVPAHLWRVAPDGRTTAIGSAHMEVSAQANTITLTGRVPGITADSRLVFKTYDTLGGSDTVGCDTWPVTIAEPEEECSPDAAVVTPGQAATDAHSDVTAAHIDITEVNSTLSGDTLTAVFHLREVPQTLTFDRPGIRARFVEYHWQVLVDLDYDPETGSAEPDFKLSADHSVSPLDIGSNAALPIETKLEAIVWERDGDAYVMLDDAVVQVSTQANTITLVGEIPGITPQAQLIFEAYDYYDGSDKVACHVPSTGEQTHDLLDTDQRKSAGRTQPPS